MYQKRASRRSRRTRRALAFTASTYHVGHSIAAGICSAANCALSRESFWTAGRTRLSEGCSIARTCTVQTLWKQTPIANHAKPRPRAPAGRSGCGGGGPRRGRGGSLHRQPSSTEPKATAPWGVPSAICSDRLRSAASPESIATMPAAHQDGERDSERRMAHHLHLLPGVVIRTGPSGWTRMLSLSVVAPSYLQRPSQAADHHRSRSRCTGASGVGNAGRCCESPRPRLSRMSPHPPLQRPCSPGEVQVKRKRGLRLGVPQTADLLLRRPSSPALRPRRKSARTRNPRTLAAPERKLTPSGPQVGASACPSSVRELCPPSGGSRPMHMPS